MQKAEMALELSSHNHCKQNTAKKYFETLDKFDFSQYNVYNKKNGLNSIGIQAADEHLDDTLKWY